MCLFLFYHYDSYCDMPLGFLAHIVSAVAGESNEVIDCLKCFFTPFIHCVAKACLLAEITN